MDIQREFQLGQERFVDATNADYFQNIPLKADAKELIEYDVKNVLSATDVFNAERQATNIYRTYGRVEYMSLLNMIKDDYDKLIDFFTPVSSSTRNLFNSFDFYLLKPSTGYTSLGNNKYAKIYEVVTKLTDFDMYESGYFVNVFNEQQYLFNFKKDCDVGDQLDGLHFPVTELALYAAYKVNNGETTERREYDASSSETGFTKVSYVYTPLNVGDTVYGNLLSYDEDEYSKTLLNEQTYYITCTYDAGELVFKYKPIIDIPIKYLDDTLNIVNISGTSYQNIQSIPYYAINIGEGNYIWRTILENGYFDPITGIGVNFPFVNQRQYVFNNFIISMPPDLTDPNTANVFTQIKYQPNVIDSVSPTDIDKMGQIC